MISDPLGPPTVSSTASDVARAATGAGASMGMRAGAGSGAGASAMPGLPPALAARLDALGRRQRRVGVAGGGAVLVAITLMLALVQMATDWWFGLPVAARAGLLVLDGVLIGWLFWRGVWGPLRRRLTAAEAALVVERRWPELRQSLITAVELAQGRAQGSVELAGRVMTEVEARSGALVFDDAVPSRGARRIGAVAAVVLAASVVLASVAGGVAWALLKRLVVIEVPRPARTVVVPVTGDLVAALGSDVKLEARGERIVPAEGRVVLTFAGETPRRETLVVAREPGRRFAATLTNVQQSFGYRFELRDAVGPTFSVRVKPRPALAELLCETHPPAYTGLPVRMLEPAGAAVIAGGKLVIRARATERLSRATLVRHGAAVGAAPVVELDATGTGLAVTLPIPTKGLTGWSLHLVDVDGIESRDDTVYALEIVPDKRPELERLQPSGRQQTITLRAKPPFLIKAKDDFGLASLTLNSQAVAPAGSDPAQALFYRVNSRELPLEPAPASHRFREVLDLEAQVPRWLEGMLVDVWAEAVDNNDVTGPGIARTDRFRYRVVSPEQKERELYRRLRRTAAQIDTLADAQRRIAEATEEALVRDPRLGRAGASPESALPEVESGAGPSTETGPEADKQPDLP